MDNRICEIRIGTSGWHYPHWSGRFYPEDLRKDKWLEHYARHFDTVEINNTFYHLPKEQTMVNWRERVPTGFLFAVKASRYITHVKKLNDPQESVRRFLELTDLLERHLGPILYQTPPSLHKDLERLDAFIEALPKRRRAAFEFRHPSWHEQDTFDLLDARGAALCVHDMPGVATPRVVTGRMVYVRLHGASGRYRGDYPDHALREWADWIMSRADAVDAMYVYFNNDVEGHAIKNAQTLKRIVGIA